MARNLLMLWLVLLATAAGGLAQDEYERDDPNDEIDERFAQAQQHNLRGEFDKAFAIYDQILSERKNDVPTLITYGNMKWKAGDLVEAEKRFKRAIELMPDHIKARQWLGQLYFHQGQRKQAREVFEFMRTMKFMREDVLHSAILNLGKIALIEEKWRECRKHFRLLRAEGMKADRKSGERGLKRMKEMMDLSDWGRVDSKYLYIHFSPEAKSLHERADRERFAARLDDFIERTTTTLGMKKPDPWHLYVFDTDLDCAFRIGRKVAHGWDFSWWLSYTAVNDGPSAEHTLAVQLVARIGASRAVSRSLTEGFCAYLAGGVADPHARARALLAAGRLPTYKQLHESQREHDQIGCGMSYVRYIIDTYGYDKFLAMYQSYNIVVNAKQFKIGISKKIDWEKAMNTLYGRTLGATLSEVESGWRSMLGGG